MAIQIVSGNINTYGNNGQFETVYSGSSWGTYFNNAPPTNLINGSIARSSDFSHSGTYSCKITVATPPPAYGPNPLTFMTISMAGAPAGTRQPLKKYIVRAWIYTPSSNPIAQDSSTIELDTFGTTTNIVKKTVAECKDTWVQIESRFQNDYGTSEQVLGLLFVSGSQSQRNGGVLYIDDFEIFEYIDLPDVVQFTTTVVNTNGPSSSNGSISITVTAGTAPFTYSNNNGVSYQAGSTFSGLAAGNYGVWVKDANNVTSNKIVSIGMIGPLFRIELNATAETSSGADDGTITVSTSGLSGGAAIGSPFTYAIQTVNTPISAFQSSNLFSNLAPDTYAVSAKDTYGNVIYAFVTVAEAITCALAFSPNQIQITNASDTYEPDGAIQVTASDPIGGGTVKYALNRDFDYNTLASYDLNTSSYIGPPVPLNTSGTFTGLVSGNYEIYARTRTNCLSVYFFRVGVDSTYEVRHRFEFDQIRLDQFVQDNSGFDGLGSNSQYRFDIEEENYAGSVEDIQSGDTSPIVISWRGESQQNPFETRIVSSELQFTLISSTDGQYEHFMSANERQFRGKLYKYSVLFQAYKLQWQGFLIPQTGSEPYNYETNYPVTLTFTDGLGDLSKFEFTDLSNQVPKSRIKAIKAISFCLKKTGINLNIYDKVNILCAGMSTLDTVGFLDQVNIDPRRYTNEDGTGMDCATVLNLLLAGCRLYQAEGAWHIDLVSQKSSATIPYRTFTSDGDNLSFEIEEKRLKIRRSVAVVTDGARLSWMERSAQKFIAERFGKIKLTYDLGRLGINNILKSNRFESVDINNGQLLGWSLLNVVSPVTTSIIKAPSRDNNCLSIRFNPNVSSTPLTLSSDKFNLYPSNGANYRLKISFDIYTIPIVTNTYIYFDYRLKFTSNNGVYYLQHQTDFNTGLPGFYTDSSSLLENGWIRVYIDEHLSWKTFDVQTIVNVVGAGFDLTGFCELEFAFFNNEIYDVDSQVDLAAITTNNYARKKFDNRRRLLGASPDFIHFYELEATTDAELYPDVIEPDDYSDSKWRLKKTLSIDSGWTGWLQAILIDNVTVGYFPDDADPESEISITEVVESKVTPEYAFTINHGDIYDSDLNYRNITTGYFTFSDGTATEGGWYRRGVTESKTFAELIINMVKGQFNTKRWLLTGQLSTFQALPQFNNTFFEYRSGKVFVPMSLTIDLKKAKADVELVETLQGTPVTDEGSPEVPPVEPPVTIGEHSNEFTNEFS